jgi:hypothetical protein
MAISQVSICSNALLILGAQPISSMDDANDRARLCNSLWDTTLDNLLRSHLWNCAIKRTSIAADSTAPAYDYSYQYTLPSDFLRLIAVGEYGHEPDHRVEGRKILCDDTPLKLRYVYRNTDVGTWDSMLVQAMTLSMAARMAYAITQSASMEQTRNQELQAHMKQARAIDGQDDPPETMGDMRLLAARYGAY